MQENETTAIDTESTPALPIENTNQTPSPASAPAAPATAEVKDSVVPKEDWFLTRVTAPEMNTKTLFDVYGVDGFDAFKDKEEYWKNKKVQELFSNTYGSEAKTRFDEAYDNSKKEFAKFQLGTYQRSQTGHELIRDDLSSLRFDATLRFGNMAGTMKQGLDWSAPTRDYRENFSAVKVKEIDSNGVESYTVKEYTPELLKELEEDPTFGGLAYSDAFYNLDPNEGVNGLYFNSIYDGRVLDEATGQMKDVRNDQVVSRWDLDTGPTNVMGMFDVNLGRFFKNNKLEADGVLDYAKILVKSPMNMAVNVMDTAVQLTRASVAGGYAIADIFTDDDLDVRASETYKWLTTKGVKLKGNVTSMSREAIQDGFFGSLEAALTTTADVALQIALAGGLGRAGAGIPGMLDKGLVGKALQQAQTRSAEVFVRGTLTAMAVKDTYNEALENGYTTGEASLITGAMGVAMWKATKYASYIFGDYEAKMLRQNIKTAMQAEQEGMLKTLFASVESSAVNAAETKSKYALDSMQKAVSKVFGTITKGLPSNRMLYIARQEGFEEMTEELFQDGVKQAASAYGYLINNAHSAGKGRYLSIFDEGYFQDAAERYATSGVAGAMGGPMGMIGNHVALSPITSASSVTDILMNGEKDELISVLEEMKNEGALGPKSLSTEYNTALEAFEPIIKGSGSESLSDMVFNNYMHDINVIDTFINKGMFGEAKQRIESEEKLKDFVDNNAMRKDYVKLMGSMLEFHNNTGISMSIYEELDIMPEGELSQRIPALLRKEQDLLKSKRKEIQELTDSIKSTSDKALVKTGKEEKPKTEDKDDDKKKVIGETEESKLTRLEKEVRLSGSVSDKDIVTMLSNYRKIRAISTGAASEYYLLQNDMADNTMLGAKYNRESKYTDLGEEPFKDMLMAMRLRSMEDEKIHAQTAVKAAELEAKILGITDADEESIANLSDILKKGGYSMLSEKALKAIVKLYAKADFGETKIAFDADHEDSIFEKAVDGKADDNDMLHLYREVLGLSGDNFFSLGNDLLGISLTPAVVKKFFKGVSKDIRKVTVPVWEETEEGFVLSDGELDLMDAINEKGTTRLKKALAVSGNVVQDIKKIHDDASQFLALGTFYKNEPFKRKSINALFKTGSGGTLTKQTLENSGLSVVKMLMDSGHDGIYTFSDTSKLDDVLSQIDVRLEMAKVLSSMTEGREGKASHYLKMLTAFRKNVLDIIDFKYVGNSKNNTEIEEHSYKDYTTTSDFFVDFLFDPITYSEIMAKDVALRTDDDLEVELDMQRANALLRPAMLRDADNSSPEIEDLIDIQAPMDQELLEAYLDSSFGDDLAGTVSFMESSKVLKVPANVFGVEEEGFVPVFFEGATKLMFAKWFFKKTRGIIEKVADKATVLPYIQAKTKDINFTIKTFRGLVESADIPELIDMVEAEVPEFAAAIRQDIEMIPATEMGAINIMVEKALYNIYNNIGKNPLLAEDSAKLNSKIDGHIIKINSRIGAKLHKNELIENATDDMKALSILTGAISTDFTPFYSKFKRDIENMGPFDRIVVAAQEHAAKYSGAYLYSTKFKQLADRWTAQRLLYMTSVDPISAVFITGVAGSGKSSAFVQLGLKLAVEILEDMGVQNTAVLPVSIYEPQVKIISDSVGALSKGLSGVSIGGLLTLLKDAVHSKNEASIRTLSSVGIIVIDEATYVEALSNIDGEYVSELEQINELIKSFNNNVNVTGHPIGLVMLGDPRQSGATKVGAEGILYDTSMNLRRAHTMAYMNFSFRSRNNFLVDSLLAVGQSIQNIDPGVSSFLTVEEGTKYGTTAGKFYGLNLVDASDNDSSAEFFKVLNDDVLVDNIGANILKNIADNAARAEGAPEVSFSVLIAPSDKVSFDATPSKMKSLMEVEGYSKYFSVVAADMVGGSEANYVIGELVNSENRSKGEATYVTTIAKKLNTLATRAFDYALIVNRNDNVVIPAKNASISIPDGRVIIPDNMLDASAKEKLKQNYLEIFKNITSDASISAKEVPVVIPGEPYEIPKDTFAVNFKSLLQFTVGDKALLSTRGISETFQHASEQEKRLLAEYLEDARSLLMQDDSENVDIRAGYINNMDSTIIELKGKISQQSFEELVGLQVFSLGILGNQSVVDILIANIDVALTTLTVDPELMSYELLPEMTITQYLGKVESAINDITMHGMYKKLFEASIAKDIDKDSMARYDALVEMFAMDLFPNGSNPSTEGLFDVDNTVPAVVDAIIFAKALFLETALPVKQPDVDINLISKQLDEYAAWVSNFSRDEIVAILKQFEPGNDITAISLLPQTAELFGLGYSSDSIKKALSDSTKMVLARMDAEESTKSTYANAVADIAKLKEKLGIPNSVVDSIALYRAISKVEERFQNKVFGKVPTASDYATLEDIITISNLWNLLYKGDSSVFGDPNDYGVGFIERDLNHKETLQDYIDASNRGNGVHTVGITKYNIDSGAPSVRAPGNARLQVVLTPKQALAQFNYNNDSTATPTGAALRVVRRPYKDGYQVDIFLMATTSSTNFVVAQIDNKTSSVVAKTVMAELLETINNPASGAFDHNGMKILDMDMPGTIRDFMYTRPGGIVTQDSILEDMASGAILQDRYLVPPVQGADGEFKNLTIADLEGKVNISGTIYVQTYKPVAGESKSTGNLRGEAFSLYSANMATSLDSADIVDNMKQGKGLTTKARIKDTAGVINTQLGLMRVEMKAPLHELGKVLKDNKDVTMGQFVSHFSLALQEHFIAVAGEFTVGREVEVRIRENSGLEGQEGNSVSSFIFTKEAADMFSEMDKDLKTHYSAATEDYKAKVDEVLNKMKSNPELKAILDDFAKAYIVNKVRMDAPSKSIKYDIIYRSPSGGYIFNVNEYLRYHPESVLQKLNELTNVSNYTLKPSIRKGETVYAGTINEVFMTNLKDSLQISALGIKVPSIIISESGTSSIRTAIRMLTTAKESSITFTNEQDKLLDALDALIGAPPAEITNKLLSLGRIELEEMLEEISSIETKVKGDLDHADIATTVASFKPRIKEVLEILKGSGIQDVSPNVYLSEYAKNTPYNSSFRVLLAEILIHYKGPTDVMERTLDALSVMGEDEEESLVETLKGYIDAGMLEVDEEMTLLLNNCKFN